MENYLNTLFSQSNKFIEFVKENDSVHMADHVKDFFNYDVFKQG